LRPRTEKIVAAILSAVVATLLLVGSAWVIVSFSLGISYVPPEVYGKWNNMPYVNADVARVVIQYLPQVAGIVFGFNGLIFVHLLSSLRSSAELAFKNLLDAEIQQAEQAIRAPKSRKSTEHDLLLGFYGHRLNRLKNEFNEKRNSILSLLVIEVLIVSFLVAAFLSVFSSMSEIDSTYGLSVLRFSSPLFLILLSIIFTALMMLAYGSTMRPVKFVEYDISSLKSRAGEKEKAPG